ncbi:hypothetical protein GGP41_004651 [Bipolaris sorokiniana]|uniref:RuvB-like helicase n=1 Tax=Cochliobolus sativus TaxID=45130 RepID=A0A8H5ZAH9_COCSA|nr:hypothetical protein GGP41_004651 [Bipolaris sorokiniana]
MTTVPVSEVKSTHDRSSRTAAHSHIKGLGLSSDGLYEGEVTELTPEEAENPLGGYGRTISHLLITLKSAKGTKKLRLDPSIYEAIQKERVRLGDVIYIEANTGAVKRDKVSSLGEKISLRYALQLLAPASVLAEVNGRENKQIEVEDVEECQDLFLDARRSAEALGQASGYIS